MDKVSLEIFSIVARIEVMYNALIDEQLGGRVAPETRAAKLHEMRREIDCLRRRVGGLILPPILGRKMDTLSLKIHSSLESIHSEAGNLLAKHRRVYDRLEEEFLKIVSDVSPPGQNDGYVILQSLLDIRHRRLELFMQVAADRRRVANQRRADQAPASFLQRLLAWGSCRAEIPVGDNEEDSDGGTMDAATNAMREDLMELLSELEKNVTDAVRQCCRAYGLIESGHGVLPQELSLVRGVTDATRLRMVSSAEERHQKMRDDESKL